MVLQSVKSVISLMCLIGIGYYFTGKKWFGREGMDFLSRFTVGVTIPFYMYYNIYNDIGNKEALMALVYQLPVTLSMFFMFLVLAAAVSKIMGIPKGRRNTFIVASGFPNVVFIGFPVIQALWGENVTSVGVVYYIASTLFFWTVGVTLLQKDGKNYMPQKGAILENLKQLFSPSIIGMLLGMATILAEIQVPDFLLRPLSMISSLTSPLALIFIGSVIRNMDKSTLKLERDVTAALAMRFLLIPAATVLFLRYMPVPKETKEVFFMLSTMPAMTQMGIMAKEYESDYEFACTIIMLTTIISMITIPLFMLFMQAFPVFEAVWLIGLTVFSIKL